jgi:4-alpha-glucanotransferase
MAIDPQYISLERVEDFAAIGGEQRLEPHLRAVLDRVRLLPAIDYRAVRELKQISLRRSFEHFVTTEWATDSMRAASLREFATEHAWWLDDYALFRALHDAKSARGRNGPSHAHSSTRALEAERLALRNEILFRTYLQWIAGEQWRAAVNR